MTVAIASEGRLLAQDLYALIQTLDPAVFRADLESRVRELVDQIGARMSELVEACGRLDGKDIAAFTEAVKALGPQLESLQSRARARLGEMPAVPDWRGLFKALQPRYDLLVRRLGALDAELNLPTLRPSNFRRSLFHISNGFVSLAVLQLLPLWLVRAIPGGFAVFAWSAEILRRVSPRINDSLMKAFAPVAHAHEWHRINSATWYASALLVIACVCPLWACSVAVMVLGLADPAAAFVGRRWGRTRIAAGRSLEGTLAFAAVGAVAGFVVLATLYPEFGAMRSALAGLAGGVSGALAELVSGRRVDDNLTIPLASAFATWAALA